MKVLLLNMKDFTIVKEFDSMEAAYAAQDNPEFAGFPKHLVERDNWDLTAVDLVKFYNNLLPAGTTPVKRFSDRPTAMARLLRLLEGEVPEIVNPIKSEEPPVKKTPAKRAAAAPKKTVAHSGNGLDRKLKPTKIGTDRRWQTGRDRSKLFAHIVKKGEVTVGELIKFGESELKLDVGTVRAALGKMVGDECVKVTG